MAFSDILSDPQNRIQLRTPPIPSGQTDPLVSLALGLAGEFIDFKKNTIAERATQEMLKEEQKLSLALSKGSINLSEYQTRLNVKQRELTANYPSIAGEIRQGIKETLGVLPTVSSAETVRDEIEFQRDLENKELEAATLSGLRIDNPDGSIDKERTLRTFRTIQLAEIELKATSGGGSAEERSKSRAAASKYFGKIANAAVLPTVQRLQKIAQETKGDDSLKYAAALEDWNNTEQNYINGVVIPTLNELGLDPVDQKTILELEQVKLKSFRDTLFTGDTAGFNRRTQQIKKLGESFENDFLEQMPGLVAANKILGQSAPLFIDAIIMSDPKIKNALDGVILRGIIGEESPAHAIGDATDAVTGARNARTLPPERKKQTAKSLSNIINVYAKQVELDSKDLQTLSGTVGALADLVSNDGSKQDVEKALAQLNTSIIYTRLIEVAKNKKDSASFGVAALNNMSEMSTKYLNGIVKEDLFNDFAEIMFNPSTGKFETFLNLEEVKKRTQTIVRTRKEGLPTGATLGFPLNSVEKLTPILKNLNNALDMATKTRLVEEGVDLRESALRQHLVDGLRFKTDPTQRRRSLPENIADLVPLNIEESQDSEKIEFRFDPATKSIVRITDDRSN